MKKSAIAALLACLFFGELRTPAQALMPDHLTPVLEQTQLNRLKDQTYFFPANFSPESRTVILPLKRWDIIFTGDHINQAGSDTDLENVNHLIPGPFNHMMVYMGKDESGLAYAIELNISSIDTGGTLALICLGYDFGLIRHPETIRLLDRRKMTHRWAKRLIDTEYEKIISNEPYILDKLHQDLESGLPYELQIYHSGNIWDTHIYLIDDGDLGGASCSDYWTFLFEKYAGLCMKDVRISAEELEAYFSLTPEGLQAYIPPEISPFPMQVLLNELLSLGYQVIEDVPHVFSCDGSTETGIVIPSLVLESPLLKEIQPVILPFPLSRIMKK